jgi:hypothetical protein
MYREIAALIARTAVGAVIDQERRDVRLSSFRCPVKWGASVRIPGIEPYTFINEMPHPRQVSGVSSHMNSDLSSRSNQPIKRVAVMPAHGQGRRRSAVAVHGVDIRTGGDQRTDQFRQAFLDRPVQRGFASASAGVNVGAVSNEYLRNDNLSPVDGLPQRRVASTIPRVDARTVSEQTLDFLQITSPNGVVKRVRRAFRSFFASRGEEGKYQGDPDETVWLHGFRFLLWQRTDIRVSG